jgi:hypothetical protein
MVKNILSETIVILSTFGRHGDFSTSSAKNPRLPAGRPSRGGQVGRRPHDNWLTTISRFATCPPLRFGRRGFFPRPFSRKSGVRMTVRDNPKRDFFSSPNFEYVF